MWQSLLERVTSQAMQGDKVLLVLGDRDSGASELIAKFADSAPRPVFHGGGGRNVSSYASPIRRNRAIGLMGSPVRAKQQTTSVLSADGDKGAQAPHESMMRFHYKSVRSTEEADKGDVISRLDIIEIFNRDVRANLSTIIDDIMPSRLEDLMVAVVVDLSQPDKIAESLQFWSELLDEFSSACELRWPGETSAKAKDKISKHLQFYFDPALPADQRISEQEKAAMEIDRSNPEINLGVPLFVAGTRADLLVKALDPHDAPKRIEALAHQMRRFCLPYGASLLFALSGNNPNAADKAPSVSRTASVTSQTGLNSSFSSNDPRHRTSTVTSASSQASTATTKSAIHTWQPNAQSSAQLFHDYVVHRLYGMEFLQQPRTFGGSTDDYEMAAVFIPSGFDTENLIKATEIAPASPDKNGVAPMTDDSEDAPKRKPYENLVQLEKMFPPDVKKALDSSAPLSADPKAEEKVSLPAPSEFLEQMKLELERSGFTRPSSGSTSTRVITRPSSGSTSTRSERSSSRSTLKKGASISAATGKGTAERLARAAAAAPGSGRPDSSTNRKTLPTSGSSGGGSVPRHVRGASGTSRPRSDANNAAVKNFFQSLLTSSGGSSKNLTGGGSKDRSSSRHRKHDSKDVRREAMKAMDAMQK